MGYWDDITTRLGDMLVTPQASPWGALLPPPTPQDRRAMIAQGLLTLGGTLAQGGAQGAPTMASLGQGFTNLTEQGARRGQQQLQGLMIGAKLTEAQRANQTRAALKRNPPPGMTPEMIDFLPADAIGKMWVEGLQRQRAGEARWGGGSDTPAAPPSGGATGGDTAPTGGVFDIPQQFAPQVTAAATKHGVPPQLLASTFWNESRWNPNAVNKNDQGRGVDSVGIGQWGEQWAKARGFDPRDPNASIEHTAAAMKEYATKYGGNWMLARLAYGWGPGNVDKWLQAGGDPAKLPDGARVWLPRTAFGIADDQQARAAFPQVAEMLRPGPARGPWSDAQIPPMQTAGVTQPNPEQPAMPPSAANPLAPLTGQGGQLPPTSVPAPNVGQPAPPQAGPGGGYGPSLGPAAPVQAPVGAFPPLRPPQAPPEPAGAPSPVVPAQATPPAQAPQAPAAGPPQGQQSPAVDPRADPKWQDLERQRQALVGGMRRAQQANDVALFDKLAERRAAIELEQAKRIGTLSDRPEELRRAEAQGARRAQIQQDTELFKEDVKDASKFASDIQNNALKSRSARANIQQLGALLEGMNTGRFTNTVVDIKRMAKGIGIDLGVADTVPQAEAARALIGQMALMLRDPSSGAGMPGAMSDADRTFLNSMVPGLETTPEGRKLMLAFMGRLHNYNIGLAKAVQDYRLSPEWKTTPQGIVRVAQQYADANPIFSEADVAAVRKVSGATPVPTNPRPEQEAPAGPPPAAADHLRKNPSLAPQFDEKYGPGASQRVLGR